MGVLPRLILQTLAIVLGVAAALICESAAAEVVAVAPLKQCPKMPFVRANNPAIQARINEVLYIGSLSQLPPQDDKSDLSNQKEDYVRVLGYNVLRNDGRIFSVNIDRSGYNAYTFSFGDDYSFDAATGQHLRLTDLFTPEGLSALSVKMRERELIGFGENLKYFREEFDGLMKVGRKSDADDLKSFMQTDSDCIKVISQMGADIFLNRNLFKITNDGIVLHGWGCSNSTPMMSDELPRYEAQFSLDELLPVLTPYGKYLFVGKGQATSVASNPFGQILHGHIGAHARITMLLTDPDNSGSLTGLYFYDRYRAPIYISGSSANGTCELHERTSQFDNRTTAIISLSVDTGGLKGTWAKQYRDSPNETIELKVFSGP